jgi:hypothetical protein
VQAPAHEEEYDVAGILCSLGGVPDEEEPKPGKRVRAANGAGGPEAGWRRGSKESKGAAGGEKGKGATGRRGVGMDSNAATLNGQAGGAALGAGAPGAVSLWINGGPPGIYYGDVGGGWPPSAAAAAVAAAAAREHGGDGIVGAMGAIAGAPPQLGRRHYKHCALHVYIAYCIHYQQMNPTDHKHATQLAYQQYAPPPLFNNPPPPVGAFDAAAGFPPAAMFAGMPMHPDSAASATMAAAAAAAARAADPSTAALASGDMPAATTSMLGASATTGAQAPSPYLPYSSSASAGMSTSSSAAASSAPFPGMMGFMAAPAGTPQAAQVRVYPSLACVTL